MFYIRLLLSVFRALLFYFGLLVVMGTCNDNPLNSNSNGDFDPPPDLAAYDKHACWSGAHNLIAYVHDQQRSLGDPDSSGIYLINPDGSERRLFLRADYVRGIDWSSNGQRIVANVGSALWKISYPGKTIDTLRAGGSYFYPIWSPDGTQIASAVHSGDGSGIYIIDSDGSNYHRIIPHSKAPDWPFIDSLIYVNLDYSLPLGSICMAYLTSGEKRIIYDPEGLFTWSNFRPQKCTEIQKE